MVTFLILLFTGFINYSNIFLSYQTQCLLFQNKVTTERKVKTCPCISLQQCVSLCAWAYVCLLLIAWLRLSCEALRSRNDTRFQELAFTRQREKRRGTSNTSHSPYPYFLHSYLVSSLALSALSSQPSLFFLSQIYICLYLAFCKLSWLYEVY